jgi:hypothetical protein
MMRKITCAFLSIAVAAVGLFVAYSQASASANKMEPTKQNSSSHSQTKVSPTHKKLILDAYEAAKKGKEVPNTHEHKKITDREIEEVLGEPAMQGPEDGGSFTYEAGKYYLQFMFDCHGKCVSDPNAISHLVEMDVFKK